MSLPASNAQPGHDQAEALLRLDDVHAYYGESHVLRGISLTVGRGEVVCLLGRNGAGKTTTLRSIMHLTPARSGNIHFDGHDITSSPPHAIARMGLGFVPEDRRIFPELTVEDNLTVVRRKPAAEGETAWPLERIYEVFPVLAEFRTRRGDVLSGGQQQMLATARALVNDPRLLLLDEPNEGLAPVIVEDIGRLIDELGGEVAILFTEHKLRFSLNHAQRAVVIERGQVRFDGTTAELAERRDVQDRYLGV